MHTGEGSATVDRFAHDEYLQVIWKTGLVGLAALLALLASTGRWLVGPAGGWADRSRWAGAGAATAALLTASSLDFLWHIPLIPLIGAVLIGSAIPAQKEN